MPSWSWLEATRVDQDEAQGGVLIRHGGKHDWYQNPETKVASRCDYEKLRKEGYSERLLAKLEQS